jgi:hypothetical protein
METPTTGKEKAQASMMPLQSGRECLGHAIGVGSKKVRLSNTDPPLHRLTRLLPKINAMDNVPVVQLVEPQVNSVRTILAQRSEVSLKATFGAWKSCGRYLSQK